MVAVRRPAVAGAFYPSDPAELESVVRRYLSEVPSTPRAVPPKAIIAPHAGYVYSGPVAATAYARVAPLKGRVRRIILLGPSHRVPLRGLAASEAGSYETPLGRVPIDRDAVAAALKLPQVKAFEAGHTAEHSLEVHLPFLQVALGDFSLVPLVVGDASAAEVAEVLDLLWGGDETLIVVSSDLSHYLDYEACRQLDAATTRAVESLDGKALGREQACGRIPIAGLLLSARRRGLVVATLDVRNSGDTAGPRDRVVGYGSWAFVEAGGEAAFEARTRELLVRHGPTLLHVAAASIEHGLGSGRPLPVALADHAPELREDGASFVTLKKGDRLRGCIGSFAARRPLVVDAAENGFAAAFRDPRFRPLTRGELPDVALSISVLSPARPLRFADQADLLAQLRPGRDGLIIEDDHKRALFLPVVWEQIPEPALFLEHLKAKAGMARDHWSPRFQAWRFVAEEIYAADLPDPGAIWTGAG